MALKSNKIAIQYNTNATNVTETGYRYSSVDKQEHPYVYSQSVNLSTIENREQIKAAFAAKGYQPDSRGKVIRHLTLNQKIRLFTFSRGLTCT